MIPPQNIEAERSVLGAMMIDDEAIGTALEILDVAWFYENSHSQIYSAILDLYNNRKNVDLVTLSEKLKSDGIIDLVGGI
ncbi:MAG: replicative DNA helicase, partial [Candidatus Omnitrophica bacterium]|nr:replicative DNA helicase [Candidatus Omnitrophota bacterium]